MKKLLFTFVLSTLGLFSVNASHITGAEVYWECLGNGNYKFFVHVYRDCGLGSSLTPAHVDINSNSPAGIISTTRIQMQPITRSCPTGVTCSNGSGSGAMDVSYYESQEITLTGTPPATGWKFWVDFCCRAPVNNIQAPSTTSVYAEVQMFRFVENGVSKPADYCFDSSPKLTGVPPTQICNGNFDYHVMGIDKDNDSLYFDWEPLKGGSTTNTNQLSVYATGYSFNNPLPGSNSVDHENGIFHLTGINSTGNFTHNVVVESWRKTCQGNYLLLSKMTREFYTKVANCNSNNQPFINASALPGGVALNPHPTDSNTYVINVMAGDSIEFKVSGVANSQNVTLKGFGGELPTVFTLQSCNTTGKCAAFTSLNSNNTFTSYIVSEAKLAWKPQCKSMSLQGCQSNYPKQFVYFFEAETDACPAPLSAYLKVVVNVDLNPSLVPTPLNFSGTITNRLPNDDVEFGWPQYTGPAADHFLLYRSIDSVNMSFSVFDTIWNVDTTYYLDDSKHQGSIWYYMTAVNACGQESDPSDTISSVWLNVSGNSSTNKTTSSIDVDLTWNRLMPIPNPTYEVWRKNASNTWLLETTTQLTHYSHNIPETERNSEYELRYNGQPLSNTAGGLQTVGLDEDEYSTTYIYHRQGAALVHMGQVWQYRTAMLTLTDVSGRVVYEEKVAPSASNQSHALPTHLSQGLYLLHINAGGKRQVLKVNL